MTPTPIGDQGPETKRLLATVGIISVLFITWKVILPQPEVDPEKVAKDKAAATAKAEESKEAPAVKSGEGEEVKAPSEPALVENATDDAAAEQIHNLKVEVVGAPGQTLKVLEGDIEVGLTTKGAQLSKWELTGYRETAKINPKTKEAYKLENAPLVDLVTTGHVRGPNKGTRLFSLKSRGGDVSLAPDATYTLVSADDRRAVFTRLTPSGVRVTRTYQFTPGTFVIDHAVELSNEGPKKANVELDLLVTAEELQGTRGGGMFAAASDELTAVCRGEDQEKWMVSELEESKKDGKPTSITHATFYGGIDRHYFLATVLPKEPKSVTSCTAASWSEQKATAGATASIGQPVVRTGVDVTMTHQPVSLAPGEKHTFEHRVFLGPKQVDLLATVDPALEENVDFGIFGVLSKPILWVLMRIYGVVGNFAIAIVLLTLLIKLLTFPLTQKSYASMQSMKVLAPEIKELQKKYGHDRTLLGQKQMEMYKEKGVSPMAGCFPMLLQMPIWFALYRTLWSSVELFQKPGFLWINDLSVPDPSPLGIPLLPFVVGLLMLGQTAFQPAPQDQPQMKYVMYGMPVMFTFFMFGMPSGLSIYMITNSIVTMAQQYYIKRKYPVPDAPTPSATETAEAGGKKKKKK